MAHVSKADTSKDPERTLGQLVAQATQDISTIVRKEIELARTEITGSLRYVAKGLPLLVGAGVLALYGLGLLFQAGAWGLHALGLPDWAGFLIMAVLLFVVAAVLALVGKKSLDKVNPTPARAIANAELTIAAVKSASASGGQHAGAGPAGHGVVALGERARDR